LFTFIRVLCRFGHFYTVLMISCRFIHISPSRPFQQHYCQNYNGRYVACQNDPRIFADRDLFCRAEKPWFVIFGRIVKSLSLADLCPFSTGATTDQYCFVIADSPYPTVGSLLASRLPNNLQWHNTVFYYVPFKLAILQYILFDIGVADTLITNDITNITKITEQNFNSFSDTVTLFSAHYASVINSPENLAAINRMCTGIITPQTMSIVNDIVNSFFVPDINAFVFSNTQNGQNPSIVVERADVIPVFAEINTEIVYNDITIQGLGSTATIGTNPLVEINRVSSPFLLFIYLFIFPTPPPFLLLSSSSFPVYCYHHFPLSSILIHFIFITLPVIIIIVSPFLLSLSTLSSPLLPPFYCYHHFPLSHRNFPPGLRLHQILRQRRIFPHPKRPHRSVPLRPRRHRTNRPHRLLRKNRPQLHRQKYRRRKLPRCSRRPRRRPARIQVPPLPSPLFNHVISFH
jgi:hypothetical protein